MGEGDKQHNVYLYSIRAGTLYSRFLLARWKVARVNGEVATFIETEAADEIAEHDQFEFTYDWSNLVQSSDKFKRMRRAQIRAWRKWQEKQREG